MSPFLKNILILLMTIFYCYSAQAQFQEAKKDRKLFTPDTIQANFLYEYMVPLQALRIGDAFLRNPGVIFDAERVNNTLYSKGFFLLWDQGVSFIQQYKIEKLPPIDTVSVNGLWSKCYSSLMDSSGEGHIRSVTSLTYEKIYLNIEFVYLGNYNLYVPNFNLRNKSKKYVGQKIPIYLITKVFESRWE
jgi:hypothetical protein